MFRFLETSSPLNASQFLVLFFWITSFRWKYFPNESTNISCYILCTTHLAVKLFYIVYLNTMVSVEAVEVKVVNHFEQTIRHVTSYWNICMDSLLGWNIKIFHFTLSVFESDSSTRRCWMIWKWYLKLQRTVIFFEIYDELIK